MKNRKIIKSLLIWTDFVALKIDTYIYPFSSKRKCLTILSYNSVITRGKKKMGRESLQSDRDASA